MTPAELQLIRDGVSDSRVEAKYGFVFRTVLSDKTIAVVLPVTNVKMGALPDQQPNRMPDYPDEKIMNLEAFDIWGAIDVGGSFAGKPVEGAMEKWLAHLDTLPDLVVVAFAKVQTGSLEGLGRFVPNVPVESDVLPNTNVELVLSPESRYWRSSVEQEIDWLVSVGAPEHYDGASDSIIKDVLTSLWFSGGSVDEARIKISQMKGFPRGTVGADLMYKLGYLSSDN